MVSFSLKFASLALLCCSIPSTSGFTVAPSIQGPSVTLQKAPISHLRHSDNSSAMMMSMAEDDSGKVDYDPVFNGKTTVGLVAGQSLLVIIAVIAAKFLVSSNFYILFHCTFLNSYSYFTPLERAKPWTRF